MTRIYSWLETVQAFIQPRVLAMLFLGFSAGIPLLLIFSSLSLWLREAGIERSAVTFFSWAALGYSFKFIWAPLVDVLPLPVLTRWLGRRRSWLLVSQCMVMSAIVLMALIDPATDALTLMALAAVLLGFSSATQDIVIDAFRIESAKPEWQALMSSTYIAGYRIGMLIAGAGTLYLAAYFGSTAEQYSFQAWQNSYFILAAMMSVGVFTTLLIKEPVSNINERELTVHQYLGFIVLFVFLVIGFISSYWLSHDLAEYLKTNLAESLLNSALASVLVEVLRLGLALSIAAVIAKLVILFGVVNKQLVINSYVSPINEFFSRYGWKLAWLLLALVGFYRLSDIVLGVMANVFYQDMGFTKPEIASVVKTFGLIMTLLGGFLGGVLSMRFGVMPILLLGAVLSAATNLLFMLMAYMGHDVIMLYVVISADNISAGLASAAFIAFLSSLTNVSFTAVQYAIFSSLMTLFPKMLGGYSGSIVDSIGYPSFFMITALLGMPVIALILLAKKKFTF
jgi:PAT family beta-lactamase induction signal transducer AmpG